MPFQINEALAGAGRGFENTLRDVLRHEFDAGRYRDERTRRQALDEEEQRRYDQGINAGIIKDVIDAAESYQPFVDPAFGSAIPDSFDRFDATGGADRGEELPASVAMGLPEGPRVPLSEALDPRRGVAGAEQYAAMVRQDKQKMAEIRARAQADFNKRRDDAMAEYDVFAGKQNLNTQKGIAAAQRKAQVLELQYGLKPGTLSKSYKLSTPSEITTAGAAASNAATNRMREEREGAQAVQKAAEQGGEFEFLGRELGIDASALAGLALRRAKTTEERDSMIALFNEWVKSKDLRDATDVADIVAFGTRLENAVNLEKGTLTSKYNIPDPYMLGKLDVDRGGLDVEREKLGVERDRVGIARDAETRNRFKLLTDLAGKQPKGGEATLPIAVGLGVSENPEAARATFGQLEPMPTGGNTTGTQTLIKSLTSEQGARLAQIRSIRGRKAQLAMQGFTDEAKAEAASLERALQVEEAALQDINARLNEARRSLSGEAPPVAQAEAVDIDAAKTAVIQGLVAAGMAEADIEIRDAVIDALLQQGVAADEVVGRLTGQR